MMLCAMKAKTIVVVVVVVVLMMIMTTKAAFGLPKMPASLCSHSLWPFFPLSNSKSHPPPPPLLPIKKQDSLAPSYCFYHPSCNAINSFKKLQDHFCMHFPIDYAEKTEPYNTMQGFFISKMENHSAIAVKNKKIPTKKKTNASMQKNELDNNKKPKKEGWNRQWRPSNAFFCLSPHTHIQ